MTSPENTIAFIGLGVMGFPMCVNLREKIGIDKELVICDTERSSLERFETKMKGKGQIRIVDSGYQALQAADTIVSMLPSGEAVKSVYLDPQNGILAAAQAIPSGQKKLVIECGTIGQKTISEVAEAAQKCSNLTFVDAPVSGGPMGSEAGTLSFMVGCDADVFSRVEAILLHMGKPDGIFHCGAVGAGTAFKTINNYISIISILTVSEALNIGRKMNLDLKHLTNVINASSGQCWVLSNNNPVPGIHPHAAASRNYEGGFRVELAHKDLSLGSELANLVGARTLLDKPTLAAYYTLTRDPRYAGKDARVVYKWLDENEA